MNNIASKLLTSCMPYAITNKIIYEIRGSRIDREYLFHLCSNNIVLIANFNSKLQEMRQDIHAISKPVSINMHLKKTRAMCNMHTNQYGVIVNEKTIKGIDRYVYLRNLVTKVHDQLQEMRRRIRERCSAFYEPDNITNEKKMCR